MLEIAGGAVRAYYLFDVADTIDLAKVSMLGGETRAPAALPLSRQAPPYLQFPVPPVGRESAGSRLRRAALPRYG